MNKLLPFLFFSLLATQALCDELNSLVYRPMGTIVGLKAYEISLEGKQFVTTTRIDQDGAEQAFVGDEAFSLLEGNGQLRYGLGTKLELRLGARFRGATSTRSDGEQVNKMGIDSVLVGAKYALPKSSDSMWNYSLDAQFRSTAHSNQEYLPGTADVNDQVVGDSGNFITAGFHMSRQYGERTHVGFYAAYNLPPNSLSQEIIYDGQLAFAWTNWALIFGVDGVYSLGTDDFFNDPVSKPAVSSGTSYMFNSINRSYTAPYLSINKLFSKWRFGVTGRTIVMGKSTDLGMEIGINLTWNSRGVTLEDRKISKFKEYDIEAAVIKISPRGKFIKIDHGLSHDVEKGNRFDIFQSDYFGGNVLVATGVVYQVGSDWAIVKLVKRYKDIKIVKGFVARGY